MGCPAGAAYAARLPSGERARLRVTTIGEPTSNGVATTERTTGPSAVAVGHSVQEAVTAATTIASAPTTHAKEGLDRVVLAGRKRSSAINASAWTRSPALCHR